MTGRLTLVAVGLSVVGALIQPSIYAAPMITNPLPTRSPEAVAAVVSTVGFFLLLICVLSSSPTASGPVR